MAITYTYTLYGVTSGVIIANRPQGAWLRFICDAEADLPTVDVIDGDRAYTEDTRRWWLRVSSAWTIEFEGDVADTLVVSGPLSLPIGAVADGEFLKRVGNDIVGASAGGTDWDDVTGKPSTFPPVIGAGGGDAVAGNDARLTDARTPTAHAASHLSNGSDPVAAATTTVRGTVELATDGESAASLVPQANDARLSNARTPTGHASSHVTGGSDVIANVVAAGNAGLMTGSDKTKLDGIASGAEVNVNADWNAGSGDAQILNKPSTFAPSAHAASHQDGGADELALDASQVTTGQLAMARLASGTPNGAKFIRDDGVLATPAGGSGNTLYAPGPFTIATGNFSIFAEELELTGTQEAAIEGTAVLAVM